MKKIFALFVIFLFSLAVVNAHSSNSNGKDDYDCPMHKEGYDRLHNEMHNDIKDEELHDEMHELMHNELNKNSDNWFSKMFRSMWYRMHMFLEE